MMKGHLSRSLWCLYFVLVGFVFPRIAANILAVDSSHKLTYQPGALICSLSNYGLSANASTAFSSALVSAFNACVLTVGGTQGIGRKTVAQQAVLVVPPGTYYLNAKTTLKGGVNWMLHLNGSQILYTNAVGGYTFVIKGTEQFVLSGDFQGSSNASHRGSLNGQAYNYIPFGSNIRLLMVQSSTNVTIGRVNFIQSPAYHLIISGVAHMEVFEVLVNGPSSHGGTDAIDVSGTHIHIHDVQVHGGDECVTVKDQTNDLLVENVLCMGNSGCSFGSFGQPRFANESGTINIQNIVYRNIYNQGGGVGWGIKACTTNNGLIQNVTVDNLIVDSVAYPIEIDFYWSCSSLPQGTADGAGNLIVRDVVVKNVLGSVANTGRPVIRLLCDESYRGSKYPTCYNITVSNVNVWPAQSRLTQVTNVCQNAVGSGVCLNATTFTNAAAVVQTVVVSQSTVPAPTWGLIQYPLILYPEATYPDRKSVV